MRVVYPTQQANQYYERNSISRGQSYTVAPAAPHGVTVRSTYTVPVGRRAIVMNANQGALRATAAGTLGLVQLNLKATLNGTTVPIFSSILFNNTVGALINDNVYMNIWLQAGDTIDMTTSDGSTGGTVQYYGAFTYMEFDA